MIDKIKLHRIVEFIKQRQPFEFQTDEVIEDLNSVLIAYNILGELNLEERKQLVFELLPMAVEYELSEVFHIMKEREMVVFGR